MFTQKAALITAVNVEDIITQARSRFWTLDHYRTYRVEYESEGLEYYSILSIRDKTGRLVLFSDVAVTGPSKITVPIVTTDAFLSSIY